jgi:protein TonB
MNMKGNRAFFGMLGLSAALHGFVLIGMTGSTFRAAPPVSQAPFVSSIKMIKVGTRPPANAPEKPREKKLVEKTAEFVPELPLIEDEEAGDTTETASPEETRKGGAEDGFTDREYEALLAHIKDFIDKNLEYPAMARRRNVEGVVGVRFKLERDGGLAAVAVDHSSGSSILDNAAVSLVKKMRPPGNLTLNRTLTLNVNITYELTD